MLRGNPERRVRKRSDRGRRRVWRSTRGTRRSTTCACAARSRCRSIATRSRARSRFGIYPVTDMLQPQFSWAFDPVGARARIRSGWRRRALRRSRLAARRRRRAAQRRTALHLLYVQFPESATGVRVATAVQAALRRARRRRQRSKRSQRAAVSAAHRRARRGTFDLAYVPWTMGADPDDSVGAGVRRRLELHALVRPARRRAGAVGLGVRPSKRSASASTRASGGSSRERFRFSTFSMPITSTRIASACGVLLPTHSCRRGTRTGGRCRARRERPQPPSFGDKRAQRPGTGVWI